LNTPADADRESLKQAAHAGMASAWHAERQPDLPAVVSEFGDRSWDELNTNANRLVRVLRAAGIGAGDAVAVFARNRPEFVEVLQATERSGIRFTPINFHLKGEEIGYIIDNCEAKAFVADATLGPAPVDAIAHAPNARLRLAVGGTLPGFESYGDAISGEDGRDIDDPEIGARMLYTSGTTGRPKGVYRKRREPVEPQLEGTLAAYRPGLDRALCTGPAYHAAPLLLDVMVPIVSGAGIVMMDKWDAEETLRLIDAHGVTHCHMVATMFHRLLQLGDEVRARYDVSSLRRVVHGAAPTPVHVKRGMIEWLGPIIWEYYAATEGGGGFLIGAEEWLKKPGSVGRNLPQFDNRILDDEGNECAPNEVGTIYLPAPETGRFEYFKDGEKTARAYLGDRFTLGDIVYFDEDGYLFLTGRSAELIISGGVNIYPQEVDSELMKHDAVLDVCTIGIPHEDFGEEVKSVVQLTDGKQPSEALAVELIGFVRSRLASFKCPRTIDFVDDLPRLPSGKIQRRHVRERYWQDRDKQI
jgi:long-chain acyl-CoA synthetase